MPAKKTDTVVTATVPATPTKTAVSAAATSPVATGGKKAAATAAGLFDGMQYLGGSFVGIGVGSLLEHFGWGAWAPSMIGFSFVGAVLMIALWNARPQNRSAGAH